MRFNVVRNLVTHAWPEGHNAAILQLGFQLALNAQEDVALFTPVVGQITGTVLDHPDAYGAELPRAPVSHSALTFVLAALDLRPVCSTERDSGHVHSVWPSRKDWFSSLEI